MVKCLRINSLNISTHYAPSMVMRKNWLDYCPRTWRLKISWSQPTAFKVIRKMLQRRHEPSWTSKSKWKCIRWRAYKGSHSKGRSNRTGKTQRQGELCNVRNACRWAGKTLESQLSSNLKVLIMLTFMFQAMGNPQRYRTTYLYFLKWYLGQCKGSTRKKRLKKKVQWWAYGLKNTQRVMRCQ